MKDIHSLELKIIIVNTLAYGKNWLNKKCKKQDKTERIGMMISIMQKIETKGLERN